MRVCAADMSCAAILIVCVLRCMQAVNAGAGLLCEREDGRSGLPPVTHAWLLLLVFLT